MTISPTNVSLQSSQETFVNPHSNPVLSRLPWQRPSETEHFRGCLEQQQKFGDVFPQQVKILAGGDNVRKALGQYLCTSLYKGSFVLANTDYFNRTNGRVLRSEQPTIETKIAPERPIMIRFDNTPIWKSNTSYILAPHDSDGNPEKEYGPVIRVTEMGNGKITIGCTLKDHFGRVHNINLKLNGYIAARFDRVFGQPTLQMGISSQGRFIEATQLIKEKLAERNNGKPVWPFVNN